METRTAVRPIEVDYKCPKCEIGFLRPRGFALTTDPPQFPHMCNAGCGYGQTFSVNYPHMDYEPIERQRTPEEIVAEINFHNLCAKATIGEVPLVTVEDVFPHFQEEKRGYPSRRNAELP